MTARQPLGTDGFLGRSGPAEIILHILQCCDSTRDLLALVSTCRHVCKIGHGNATVALWPVWLHKIPHFEEAVTAVNADSLGLCYDVPSATTMYFTKATLNSFRTHEQRSMVP